MVEVKQAPGGGETSSWWRWNKLLVEVKQAVWWR